MTTDPDYLAWCKGDFLPVSTVRMVAREMGNRYPALERAGMVPAGFRVSSAMAEMVDASPCPLSSYRELFYDRQ